MITRRHLILLSTILIGVAGCTSPTTATESRPPASSPQFTAADSGAARGGGNLMGGN